MSLSHGMWVKVEGDAVKWRDTASSSLAFGDESLFGFVTHLWQSACVQKPKNLGHLIFIYKILFKFFAWMLVSRLQSVTENLETLKSVDH